MRDKQRWQPEEDALLCDYVKQYGPTEWNLVSERMATPLDRDPKSCHERWKNYLKPGLKRGPLSDEEQHLVIRLQEKYGNKWKRIAAEVPGRTAKRLGKWWEVYKERKQKEVKQRLNQHRVQTTVSDHLGFQLATGALAAAPLMPPTPSFSTYAEGVPSFSSSSASEDESQNLNHTNQTTTVAEPVLTLGPAAILELLPAWKPRSPTPELTTKRHLSLDLHSLDSDSADTCLTKNVGKNSTAAKDDEWNSEISSDILPADLMPLLGLVKELEERKDGWSLQKRSITSRLRELKHQLESERVEKRKEKMLEVESKIQALRNEEKLYLDKLEIDYAELVSKLDKDAELNEEKFMESWSSKYSKLVLMFEQIMKRYSSFHGPIFQAVQIRGLNNPA